MLLARLRPLAGRLAVATACVALGACTKGGPSPGATTRMNEPEKTAASFSFPYYTDIVAVGDEVAAAYMTLNGREERNVVVRQSSDGGATWSEGVVLNAPEYGDTISVAPKLATLPNDVLVAVWQARRNRAGQKFILARRSTDFGKTWGPIERLNTEPQSFPPSIAARDDGTVLVAYSDERDVERDIYTNRSSDGGATWLPKDVAVNSPAKTESIGPWPVLGAGNDAWVVWEEKKRGSPRIEVSRSSDGGLTWGAPVRVDAEKQEASPIWPMLVEAGGRLVAVWTAGLVGDRTQSWLWVATSTDGGGTWSAPQKFYEGPAQAVFQLVARGSRVYLVWNAGGSDGGVGVYFNASDDGGATWRMPLDAPARLDEVAGKSSSGRPRIALAGDDKAVAVVWQEEEKRILLRASADGGRTWSGPPMEIARQEKNRLRFPVVATTETAAWVLWEEWADMTGVRKTLADIEKLTPVDVYVRKVTLR